MGVVPDSLDGQSPCYVFFFRVVVAIALQALRASSAVVPSSNCYAFDNSSHLYDFVSYNNLSRRRLAFSMHLKSSWIGHTTVFEGKNSDLAVRFCKDVESRAQKGYTDFGRFDNLNYFVAGSGHVNFVQEFYNGDLVNCEHSYDKMGRTAQVNIVCGSCLNGSCKGELGCICNVTYESPCRVLVELAIPCEKPGARVFEGFTVGFHPRSWEIVYNGLTRMGFEKSHHEFSFGTEQTSVVLYMTAVASLSNLVKKPNIKVVPENGLEVRLSGSGAAGSPPTTLSPSTLVVDWRCENVRDAPYEVDFIIPVEGFESIQFKLTKMCEYRQEKGGGATRGWAIFGVMSCIFVAASTLLCCGHFIYTTRVQHQRGLDALPGITILSACLETMSGGSGGYSRVEDTNSSGFSYQASWEREPASNQGAKMTNERRYGSI